MWIYYLTVSNKINFKRRREMKKFLILLFLSNLSTATLLSQACPDRVHCSNEQFPPGPGGYYFSENRITFKRNGSSYNSTVPTPYSVNLESPAGQLVIANNLFFDQAGNQNFSTATCEFEIFNSPYIPTTIFTGYIEFPSGGTQRRCYYNLGDLIDVCELYPENLDCPTGDFDGDGIVNGDDPAPEDPCVPNGSTLVCDIGDNDQDGVPNNEDDAPDDPCIPDPTNFICENLDDDGDGYPNIIDPKPNNPNWPVELVSLSCREWLDICPTTLVNTAFQTIGYPQECTQWLGSCNTAGMIYRQGAVALGTSYYSPLFNLQVKGGILTEQYKVTTTEWGDYVFEPDYDLMNVSDLRNFINQNNHLPGVPTEEEILAQKGFDLAEMKKTQQVKLEEAYLYLFQLDDQLKELEKRLNVSKN